MLSLIKWYIDLSTDATKQENLIKYEDECVTVDMSLLWAEWLIDGNSTKYQKVRM